MAERIYIRAEDGGLEPLEEERFSTEDELQALLAEHPELLDGEQMRPGDPRRWILITREKGISETSGSNPRWALDHLIIDQDAVPTLAEVKRGSNTEIRRTIVGQLLEYAAHAAETWTADELRRTFEKSAADQSRDPDEVLDTLLQSDGEPDADSFWQSVATNLAAKRLRLLFVADEIPDTLQRIVEFLNAQMPNIEVLAVEIKQFGSKATKTFVPRVLGRTADTSIQRLTGRRPSLNRETFLGEFTNIEVRSAAARLLDKTAESGATFGWGSSAVSIRGQCSRWKPPISVAWLYPPSKTGLGFFGTNGFNFGAAIFGYDPPPDDELRRLLTNWANRFKDDSFTTDASSKGMIAWSVGYEDAVEHVDLLAERVSQVLAELRQL